MPEPMDQFNDPNVSVYDGMDRIMSVQFGWHEVFRRRGGKAVDKHNHYHAATANSSNLAGFAEVDEVGVHGGHPEHVHYGMLPVNFDLHKTCVFPTTGRPATEVDRGHDFDLYVDGNGVQFVNLNASSKGILRVSRIVTADGMFVSCGIPPDMRYGNI